MASWLDSHTHINDQESFKDLKTTFDNMVNNDVLSCMIVSLNANEFLYSKTIQDKRIKIKRSIGLFPEDVAKQEIDKQAIFDLFKEADAVGEIGLDYYWNKETKELQKEYFIKQIEMANELNKPVIVHLRDALQDGYDILKKYPCKGVLHCYSGSAEMAKEFIKLGYYISIAGTVTFKNAKEPKEVIKVVPFDRLLIETDCPYLTPVPHRGEKNEPAYVVHTGKYICEQLGIDEESFKKQISANYTNLFGE